MNQARPRKAASTSKGSPRRRKAPSAPVADAVEPSEPTNILMPEDSNANQGPEKNVGQAESLISATIGGLLLVRGLVPRSFKQATFLLLGGALLYRGLTSHCNMYQSLGINTDKNSLLDEVNDKVLHA